ncbi:SDR family NAD(P)-dependent oxidoreductase [Pseudomaricurvus alkylphenolicus]|uniref:SDR family NAD(P)-dependent oxidoreductase n=1 Tax=Pseudomaricurvus alkylphenolicus TaxID=1306991 RepID=UPI00197E7B26|nr:SDR family oxidoreductase [Pseudomaricurvus alkylphenolicus]
MDTQQASLNWPRIRFDFCGIQVLVTGGTSGIGLAIATAFVEAGACVTITGTRKSPQDYDNDLRGFHYRQLNLTDLDSVERLGKSLRELDVLVNNAGATYGSDAFEKELLVNLTSVHRLTCACEATLKRSQFPGGASVINIASMMSFFGSPYFPGYGAAKAGIVQMTKTFTALWAAEGVRVNAVAAGSIATPMTDMYVKNDEISQSVISKTPMGRWGTPKDIAGAVMLLCSPAAAFVCGHTLVADGGYSIID